jgi:hypothetical protein
MVQQLPQPKPEVNRSTLYLSLAGTASQQSRQRLVFATTLLALLNCCFSFNSRPTRLSGDSQTVQQVLFFLHPTKHPTWKGNK